MPELLSESQIAVALERVEECLGAERPLDAVADLQDILASYPNHPMALCGIGRVSIQLGDNDSALQVLDLVVTNAPDLLEARNARGVVFQNLGRLDDAEIEFRHVVKLVPDNPGALLNLASLLAAKGDNRSAEETFRQVLALRPGNPTAAYNLGLLQLAEGRFEDGWKGFEYRNQASNVGLAAGRSPMPKWDGTDIKGSTLVVQAEQGLGDNIQFARYLIDVTERVGRLVLEAPAPLKDLFSNIAGPDQVIGRDEPLPAHDFQIPIMSLPAVLGTTEDTIPSTVPYLAVAPEKIALWRKKMDEAAGGNNSNLLHVGFVWAGNPSHKRDRERSLSLSALEPLVEVPGIFFHSLQVGDAADEFTHSPFRHRGRRLFRRKRPFDDVAAAIGALDLLIGVDTSLVHLAGALGTPVWTLVSFVPDWRWMLDRTDTPWYPSMRIYRQPAPGDWGSVMAAVAADLEKQN